MPLRIELTRSPSYPAELPSATYWSTTPPAIASGAEVELVVGSRSAQGKAYVELMYGRFGSLRIALEKMPYEELVEALSGLWGPAPYASKTKTGWVDSMEAPAFRVRAFKFQSDVTLHFEAVSPLQQFISRVEAALEGKPVLPRVGMTQSELATAFPDAITHSTWDGKQTREHKLYCLTPPHVFGSSACCSTVVFDAAGKVSQVTWSSDDGALDGKKAIKKAVADFWKRRKAPAGPVQLGDNVEFQLFGTLQATFVKKP